ncbi:MAG: ssDNA-binding replication factor A large subunit [Methanobacteriota archaeon]|jgi:ssDNA-binding replication factor A large subunit|uniref:Replication factor A n=1 Tax=Halorutilus salinus TaxID=2487751 RepID=A0A9Q4C5D5_9EURY|nr:replication factor A [Halorutilus salinus]MCX2819536.1 replication factor A [Halorutilus salinus]
MTETEIRQTAEQIAERFSEQADVSVDDVEERLQNLVEEYKVPMDEARRSVTSHFAKETGVSRDELGSEGSENATVAQIDTPEEWLTVDVKVAELWEPSSDSIAQTGLVGDETGTIKFTSWAKSDVPTLEEGATYRLQNVVTDEFQGRMSVKLNSSTEVEEIDAEIEVGEQEIEVEGALVAVQSGSGLIKRCPEDDCTRVLQNGRCSEHGEVEGEFDMRVKGVLDDGNETYDVLLDREATERVTGIEMEEAKQEAMDALDTSVVTDRIKSLLVGRYFRVEGPRVGRYVLGDDVEEVDETPDADALLMEARSA